MYHAGSVGIIMSGWLGAVNYGVIVANDVDCPAAQVTLGPALSSRRRVRSQPMSLAEIHAAIPHREPFLLVDEIVERERIADRLPQDVSRPDEDFFAGHYPGYPLMPGVLLCEAAMQAGAVLLSGQCLPPTQWRARCRWPRG